MSSPVVGQLVLGGLDPLCRIGQRRQDRLKWSKPAEEPTLMVEPFMHIDQIEVPNDHVGSSGVPVLSRNRNRIRSSVTARRAGTMKNAVAGSCPAARVAKRKALRKANFTQTEYGRSGSNTTSPLRSTKAFSFASGPTRLSLPSLAIPTFLIQQSTYSASYVAGSAPYHPPGELHYLTASSATSMRSDVTLESRIRRLAVATFRFRLL